MFNDVEEEAERKKPYEILHGVRDRLIEHARYFDSLAYSFRLTGNENMALDLAMEAQAIQIEADLIDEATGRWLDKQLNESRQATANMIGAALAVGTKNKEGDNE